MRPLFDWHVGPSCRHTPHHCAAAGHISVDTRVRVTARLAGGMARLLPSLVVVIGSLCLAVITHAATNSTELFDNLVFSPPKIEQLVERAIASVYLHRATNASSVGAHVVFRATSHDDTVAEVIANVTGDDDDDYAVATTRDESDHGFRVRARLMGRTYITFYARTSSSSSSSSSSLGDGNASMTYHDGKVTSHTVVAGDAWVEVRHKYPVSVIRKQMLVDKIFIYLLTAIVVGVNIGMGCAVDLAVVRSVLRRPVAPAIGLCSQFLFMPLMAFGIVKLMGMHGGRALGYFAIGCVPGGGQSNMYTLLLRGDVSLSVTMTLVSDVASLAMMPLWLLTLGQLMVQEDGDVQIPFIRIIISLMAIIVPLSIGILIGRFRPPVARQIGRLLKPILLIITPFMIAIGVYTNLFIFRLITPMFVLAGCSLPYLGFLFGGLMATLLRQPLRRVVAITIETGIQNVGLGIMVLKYSLPQPEADLAMVGPVAVAILTPLPLWIAIATLEIRKRWCRRQAQPPAGAKENGAPEVDQLLSDNTASTSETAPNHVQTTPN